MIAFPGAQGVRESAGNYLTLMFVRRDVNVGRADQFHKFLWADEAVAENYVGLDAQVFRELLQRRSVLVALPAEDMRVGYAGESCRRRFRGARGLQAGLG